MTLAERAYRGVQLHANWLGKTDVSDFSRGEAEYDVLKNMRR
jgi:hypothetical protein